MFPRTSDRRDSSHRIALRVAYSIATTLVASLWLPALAQAAWSSSPTQNLPVCTARGNQIYRAAISDGAGGVITAWSDTRSDTADVYAQRIDAGGNALWGVNGSLICGAPRDQDQPTLASDGSGGAIVVWRDFRAGATGDLYAQRLDAAGLRQWSANGIAVCTAADEQANPVIVTDAAGGAIVAWEDWRTSTPCIYAQRVTSAGQVKWRAGGEPLSSGFSLMFAPVALADGLGGAYVAWLQQSGTNYDLFGQHVEADSTVRWAAVGSPICTAPGDQLQPVLALSGIPVNASSAGVYVVWQDRRGPDADLYAQRFSYYGVPFWTPNGVPVCAWSADQTDPAIIADNTGGLLCVWHDLRGGNDDLYAQHLDATAAAKWTSGGLSICNAAGAQQFPAIASDGQGGAIIAWEDDRTGTSDIYAQRVTSAGSKRWAPNGAPVSTAPSAQYQATVVTNADSVAIVIWQDQRTSGSDLYAQRIPFAITLDAPSPGLDAVLLAAGPEPSAGEVGLRFVLSHPQPCELAVFDAAGRRVRVLAEGLLGAGVQERRWDGRDAQGAASAAGVYFARLAIGGQTAATRRITLRR